MVRNPKERKFIRCTLALVLSTVFLSAADAAQLARRKSKISAAEEDYEGFTKPQLLNADTNPILRYPVANFSGWSVFSTSYGWFDVSRDGIRFTVVEPASKKNEGYEASSNEINDIKVQQSYLRFYTGKKHRTIFYMPRDRWGAIHSGPGALQASTSNAMGTGSILQALRNFDRALTMVRPPPAAPAPSTPVAVSNPAPAPPATPPTIVLIEPSISNSGQTIDVTNASLTVRGVAMDSSGLPVVNINGSPANMKPRNAQAAEFWSEPIALHSGENKLEVVATNSAQAANKFVFTARYNPPEPPKPPPPPARSKNALPLAKSEILELLKGMQSAQVAALVRENGIKFTPTYDDLKEVRAAGGGDDLIEAVKQAASQPQ